MRVGIYTRSATGDPVALGDQEARCRTDAAVRGWEVAGVWADAGSGLSEDRSGLRALREAMAARQVEAVLATDAVRLARDGASLDRLVVEAEATDVAVVLLDGSMDPLSRRLMTAGLVPACLSSIHQPFGRRPR